MRLVLIILLFALKCHAQNSEKYVDSLAISELKRLNPETSTSDYLTNTPKGDRLGKNYYAYYALIYQDSKVKCSVINFGTFTTEKPIYMMIALEYKGVKSSMLIGKEPLNNDLSSLDQLLNHKEWFAEELILNLYELVIRCRKGQRQTPRFLKP